MPVFNHEKLRKMPNQPDRANRRQPLDFRERAGDARIRGFTAAVAHPGRLDKDQFSFLSKTYGGVATVRTKRSFGRGKYRVALLRLRSTPGALDPTAAQRDGGY